jgi:hypothetical protein
MGYIAFNQTRILSSTTKKRKKERKKERINFDSSRFHKNQSSKARAGVQPLHIFPFSMC